MWNIKVYWEKLNAEIYLYDTLYGMGVVAIPTTLENPNRRIEIYYTPTLDKTENL